MGFYVGKGSIPVFSDRGKEKIRFALSLNLLKFANLKILKLFPTKEIQCQKHPTASNPFVTMK
jgi:hypothetical protein